MTPPPARQPAVQPLDIESSNATVTSAAWDGMYSDPNHPLGGFRVIEIHGMRATITGRDTAESAEWTLEGKVSGSTIQVDFTPKGGPSRLEGKLVQGSPSQIRWQDGNMWTRTDMQGKKPIGDFNTFLPFIVVSAVAMLGMGWYFWSRTQTVDEEKDAEQEAMWDAYYDKMDKKQNCGGTEQGVVIAAALF